MAKTGVLKIGENRIIIKNIQRYSIEKTEVYHKFQNKQPRGLSDGAVLINFCSTICLGGSIIGEPKFDPSINWKYTEFNYLYIKEYNVKVYKIYSDNSIYKIRLNDELKVTHFSCNLSEYIYSETNINDIIHKIDSAFNVY